MVTKWTESWSSAKGQNVALQMRTCKFDCESMDAASVKSGSMLPLQGQGCDPPMSWGVGSGWGLDSLERGAACDSHVKLDEKEKET